MKKLEQCCRVEEACLRPKRVEQILPNHIQRRSTTYNYFIIIIIIMILVTKLISSLIIWKILGNIVTTFLFFSETYLKESFLLLLPPNFPFSFVLYYHVVFL